MPLLDVIHCCDALTLLRGLPNESVDTVVTSPPYNLRNSSGNGLKGRGGLWTNNALVEGYSNFSDDMPHDKYIAWQRQILQECWRVIKPTGAIFYNHKWRVQDGELQRLAENIIEGLPLRQIIVWYRGNGFNFNDGYFLPTYEVIYLLCKPNFKLLKGEIFHDVWQITPTQNKYHPDSFPLELAHRCVVSSMPLDGIVLDPFMGSGTTAVAAKRLGGYYLGCDISPEYVELAKANVAGRLDEHIRRQRNEPHTQYMFDMVSA